MSWCIHIASLAAWVLLSANGLFATDLNPERWIVIHTSLDRVTNTARVTAKIDAFSRGSPEAGTAGFAFSGQGQIHIRGASSRTFAKTSYALELQDDDGEDLKTSLFGLPDESDWVLYASYTDKTFIRDALAYDLWRAMGYYAPRTTYIDLFFLGDQQPADGIHESSTDGYHGLYVLAEKIKRGKHRVNIEKLPRHGLLSESEIPTGRDASSCSNDPLSGGYIFKKDRLGPGEKGFSLILSKILLTFVEPKEREITAPQRNWLGDYLNEFEAALFGGDFRDPTNGYAKYIDVDSFIDYHWMIEVGKCMDGYRFSQFYHKDRGGKLKMGPLWDWDLSFGNAGYDGGWNTAHWRWERMRDDRDDYVWFKRLFEDPDFLQRYIDRWSELRTNILATRNVLARVDAFAAEVRPKADRNFQRWPILGKRMYPNHFVGKTYDEEVNWLKQWISNRLAWIDSQDFPKPVLQVTGPLLSVASVSSASSVLKSSSPDPSSFMPHPTSLLSMSCDPNAGSIFYTTNNTDPRLPGGHVSTNALEYKSPVPLTTGLQVRARVRSEFGLWSAPALYP